MTAKAWLLTLEYGVRVAVGERELMHIVSNELEHSFVPMAPAYANEVIAWQNRLIPLFNVTAALQGGDIGRDPVVAGTGEIAVIAITAYQVSKDSQVELGALSLVALPERIEVADDSGCELPSEPAGWRRLTHSCYQHPQHGAVPILDLRRMFAPEEHRGPQFERSARH